MTLVERSEIFVKYNPEETLIDGLKDSIMDEIDNSRIAVVVISKMCLDRVRGKGLYGNRDSSAFAFDYTLKKLGASHMIPIVMEESSADPMRWSIILHSNNI
jgi:hypothetical protein